MNDWTVPTGVHPKYGHLDRIACGEGTARITSDWLPFAPGTRKPLPESWWLPPADEDDPQLAGAQVAGPWRLSHLIGSYRFRHASEVEAIAVTPDSRCAAVGTSDGTVVFWDLVHGREIRTWRPFDRWMWALAISPDGTRIAACTHDHLAVLGPGGEQLSLEASLRTLAFSPCSRFLLGGSSFHYNVQKRGFVQLYRVADWTPVWRENCLPLAVGFRPDGSAVLALTGDKATGANLDVKGVGLREWRMEPSGVRVGKPQRTPIAANDESAVRSAAFACHADSTIVRIGRRLLTIHEGAVVNESTLSSGPMAFSKDGQRLADGGGVLDSTSGRRLVRFADPPHSDRVIAWTPDGNHVLCGSDDRSLRIWNAHTGDETFANRGGSTDHVTSLSVNSTGDRLLAVSLDGMAQCFSLRDGAKCGKWTGGLDNHQPRVTGVLSPDGNRAIAFGGTNQPLVVDLTDDSVAATIELPPERQRKGRQDFEVTDARWLGSKTIVLAGGIWDYFDDGDYSRSGAAWVWQDEAVKPVRKVFEVGDADELMTITPGDDPAIVQSQIDEQDERLQREQVRFVRIRDGAVTRTIEPPEINGGFTSLSDAVAISPDGQVLVSGANWRESNSRRMERSRPMILAFDLSTGELRWATDVGRAPDTIAFTQNGAQVVVWGGRRHMSRGCMVGEEGWEWHCFDSATGRDLTAPAPDLTAANDATTCMAATEDGRWLAFGTARGLILVYEDATVR